MGRQIHLRGMTGPFEGRDWMAEGTLRIGRDEHLEVVLEDESVSRFHARIAWEDGAWRVQDLGSILGTRLNGDPVGATGSVLRTRDVLQLGDVLLLVVEASETPGRGRASRLPDHAFYSNRGRAHNQASRFAQALEDLTQAIRLGAKEGWVYCQRGYTNNKLGRYTQAIEDLTEAIRLDGTDRHAHANRGWAYNETGQYRQAVEDLTEALRLGLNEGWVHRQRGYSYNKLARYAQAIEDLNEAIRLDPADRHAHAHRGWAHNETGRYDRAAEDLTEALRLGLNEGWVHRQRGFACNKLGQFDTGIQALTEALRLDPMDRYAYGNRGWGYNETGQYALAVEDLTEALRLGLNEAWVHRQRGYSYNKLGRYVLAIENLTEALRLDPADRYAFANRGWARQQRGEHDLSIADWNEAIRLDPDNSNSLLNRGYVFNDMGQYDRAVADYVHGLLQVDEDPAAFIRRIAYLGGLPETQGRLIPRLVLGMVCVVKVLARQWDAAQGPDESFWQLVKVGSEAAESILSGKASTPTLAERAEYFGHEAERYTRGVPPGATPVGDQALIGSCFAVMCQEACLAVEARRWPAIRFWDGLLLASENKTMIGTRRLSRHEPWMTDVVTTFLLCTTGSCRSKPEIDPRWLTWGDGAVRHLARAIFAHDSYQDMPVLADALVDGGCTNEEIIAHCRESRHGGGCWVLDALLGTGEDEGDAD